MARKVDVMKSYKKLPYEAQQQIDTILMDDGLSLKDVSINYIIDDVKYTIDRMYMDIGEGSDTEEPYEVIRECNKWMSYYKRYDLQKI